MFIATGSIKYLNYHSNHKKQLDKKPNLGKEHATWGPPFREERTNASFPPNFTKYPKSFLKTG